MEEYLANLSHYLDEMSAEAAMSKEKAQRPMINTASLANKLCAEQDMAMVLEPQKKLLEAQAKDAQNKLDEAEQHPGGGQECRVRGSPQGPIRWTRSATTSKTS